MADSVLVFIEDGIATLTLNRPERLNAWHTPMRMAVADALDGLNRDPSVGAIILTGAGERAFSAGQDLAETMAFDSGETAREWFLSWRAFYDSLRNLDKGCVAALNGVRRGVCLPVRDAHRCSGRTPRHSHGAARDRVRNSKRARADADASPARPLAYRRAHTDRPHDVRGGVSPHRSDPPPGRPRSRDVEGTESRGGPRLPSLRLRCV